MKNNSPLVAVTAPLLDNAEQIDALQKIDIRTLAIPAITTRRERLSRTALTMLEHIDTYDWLLFTSAHGVNFFVREIRMHHIAIPRDIQIAVVGPATAHAVVTANFRVSMMPRRFTAADVVKNIGTIRDRRILFPADADTTEDTRDALEKKGAIVNVLPVYTIVPATISLKSFTPFAKGSVAAITFLTPTSIMGLVKNVRSQNIKKIVLATPTICIGPRTRAAAIKAGFTHAILAKPHTLNGVVAAIKVLTQ